MAQILAINWIEVTAVRQPQIWHNERMADDFIQFLFILSLQTLQTKMGCMMHQTVGLCPAFLAECQFFHHSHIVFTLCALPPASATATATVTATATATATAMPSVSSSRFSQLSNVSQ